jgi:hypothetical protein
VSIDMDYPRSHALPVLLQVRNGAFASPGMKRERAILDAISSRDDHKTVSALVADVAARLAGPA